MRPPSTIIYLDTIDSRTGATTPGYTSASASIATNLFGRPINLNGIWVYTIQAVISGGAAPTGTLSLEGSCDSLDDPNQIPGLRGTSIEGLPLASAMNWTPIANSSQAVANNGNWVWNVADAGYEWVRLKWVFASGTGTLSARFKGKGPT